MEQQFITAAARRASCFMHGASFRAFINELGLTSLFGTILQSALLWSLLVCEKWNMNDASKENGKQR